MKQKEIARAENPIKKSIATGKRFSDFPIQKEIIDSLEKMGFTRSTPVQDKTIPFTMEKCNVICASETGSGKTLAFLIPIAQRLLNHDIHQSLILCPTREIAIQTNKVLSVLLGPLGIKAGLVIGGMDMREQKLILREYPSVLVATPGRLLDMIRSGLVWLEYTQFVVLDEADRMLDMGFEKELIEIHKELSGDQQTLLFTATLMPGVEQIALRYADQYKKILLGKPMTISSSIDHFLIHVSIREKLNKLKQLLRGSQGQTIVFFNTIKAVIENHRKFQREKIHGGIISIHSGKSQEEREKTLNAFRKNQKRVLLATDVAARGIDIPQVDLILNYDLPTNPEEYIHRVGRTGRAGRKGIAKSFYTAKDKNRLAEIEKILKLPVKVLK